MSEDRDLADELFHRLHALSMEVFELAKETATGQAGAQRRQARAEQLNEEFDTLQPRIAELPADQRDRLYRPLTEGRMDLAFVLSDGHDHTTSTRLHYFLENLRKGGGSSA